MSSVHVYVCVLGTLKTPCVIWTPNLSDSLGSLIRMGAPRLAPLVV